MNLNSYLDLAIEAANAASIAILNERQNLKIWQKEDNSPVSSADLISNEILTQNLAKTDIEIFSEEKILPFEKRKNLEYFWLIDPLDGTSSFLKQRDEFCIMIALIHKQRPILSLIKNPTNDDIFYAHKDTKVYKNYKILEKDESLFKENQFTALLSVNHLSATDAEFANKHKLKALNISSGLKFTALLEGKAGVYRRAENLSIWDIAAGDFLINQNGGFMGDFNAKFLNYNQKNHRTSFFLAVSEKSFLKAFL